VTVELAIDARWLRTGIGRYTQTLLPGLRRHLPGIRVTCLTQSKDAALLSHFADRVTVCDAGIYGFREQWQVPRLAANATALYVPHYNIPLLWRGKLLVTIHDLNHLLDKGYRRTWRSRIYARPMIGKAAERADAIVTPSRYTMVRLMEKFRVEASRVHVIPCCVAPGFVPQGKLPARARIAERTGIRAPFLLFVGSCAPNKNLPLLLNAIATLRRRRRDVPLLVIAGGRRRDSQIQQQMLALGLEKHVVWVREPEDSLLADLYCAALMTVMPSFEEGFGLPVIESMACGTPVLCSRAASLPEAGGDAALYFSPYSREELTAAIETLLDSSSLQGQLISAGVARAAAFSQSIFVERQAAVMRAILAN
jgi:glycosyltransferase involved in cell wall biosynthesis